MDSERWKQVDNLYQAALTHGPEERESFLRDSCAGDRELESDVRSLLAAGQDAGNFLESPAMEAAARAVATDPGENTATLSQSPLAGLAVGRTIGPYRIEEALGAGGMGEVFRATDTRLGRAVAIKTCREEFNDRFHREARAISSLNHPHICTLYDVGSDYLVMELIEGGTLAARVKRGRLPLDQAIRYGVEIADALAAAHAKGIVHRDLKPGNIMIAKSGVKVLDFGLARSVKDETITATRGVLGTPAYMAPEQCQGRDAGPLTDIYALGVVLREMATGIRDGSTAGLPPAVAHVIERCLPDDPEERWQTASDVARELKWAAVLPAVPAPTFRPVAGWLLSAVSAAAVLGVMLWLRPAKPVPGVPVRVSSELTRVGVADGTFRLDGTILHREQPGAFMALSPDGTRLVVQVLNASGDVTHNRSHLGSVRLAVRRLDENEFKPLAGTEDPTGPFFSPDGQWIAFFGDGKLRKIPVQGGVPVTLCATESFGSGSWGDDDNIIGAFHKMGGLSRVPAGGGAPAAVTELRPGEIMHRWPQVLPHSEGVLFTSYTGAGPEEANIDVLMFKTGTRKTLVRGGAMGRYLPTGNSAGYLVYLHQHTLLAIPFHADRLEVTGLAQPVLEDLSSITSSTPGDFDISANGTLVYLSGGKAERSIFWLDASGQQQPLHPTPGSYNSMRFSPDGKRLVFAAGDPQKTQDLWVRDLERNTVVRITPISGSSQSPVWFPDSRHILFGVFNQPAGGLYWTRADGGAVPRRLVAGDWLEPTSIAPDGRTVALQRGDPFTGAELLTAPIEGPPDRPVLGSTNLVQRAPSYPMPAFSPDGHWLAYGTAETGADEVYVQPFPGPGERIPVSVGGGEFPAWSPNGHELFFLAGNRIMVAGYSIKGSVFVPGKPRLWTEQPILDVSGPFIPYAVAPDGRRLAVLLYPDGRADQRDTLHLTFVVNFLNGLRRRFGAEAE
jgi:serine/threonine-protein kinase